jgi:hypothetical protein
MNVRCDHGLTVYSSRASSKPHQAHQPPVSTHALLQLDVHSDVHSVEPRECTDSGLLRKLLEGYLGMGECVLTCLEFAINGLDMQNIPVGSKK